MIQKSKLVKSTEQVKVGTKGKHGVIAGRELTGNFQASAAPLYVWMRSNGELWLISGRHRYELMMRDNGVDSHPCYVFREDAEHDEKWARMMDYENNMRDDQADELTAGTYVRETGLSDAELEVRGLMRNESRSKRGALIGRHAREELWTRFSNGKIKAKDAEVICNLTRYIKDQSRVDEIQRRCCMLLDNGKSWDYIGGMVQLMVQAELEQGQQGWFNFGADFEAALERAATWIEKALKAVNENIELAKRGRDMSGKKADKAARLGIVTSAGEDVQQTLQDLQVLKGKLELIGSYPELRQQAEMWDGESEVDPVGWMLQQQALENERLAAEKELEAEEYLKQQQAEATGTLFSMSMGTAVDLQTVTNAWQNTLQRFVVMPPAAGTAPYRKDIVVCPTPAVMQMVGVTAWDIVISPSVLVKCLHKDTVLGNKKKLLEYYPKEKHEHDIELSEMMQLPAALADPVCIVVSDTPGCVEVVTELKEDNKNVLVAVQLNGFKEGSRTQRVNRIASLYGKDKIEAILTHPRLYWNKAKARVWTGGGRLQLPTAPYPKRAPKHKVLKPEDLVKYKSENNLSFSMERNLAAVHSIPLDTMLQVEKTLGGLAKPSIAITRLDKPYSWGGDTRRVYLIGRPELADPQKGNLVYDRDAWTGKGPFLMESGGAYDYRKGEYFEPTLEAFVSRTIKKKGMEEGADLRAQSAVQISTMEAVKLHREKLSDTEESTEQKIKTDEALDSLIVDVINLNKKGLNYEEVAYILAKVCWRSSPLADGAPSIREVSRDQAKRILNEMGIRVKDIKKPLVDKFVKAVGGLKNELEDYLESVPQRAVMFNEFEYAVMPVSARETAGLDEMLQRNGIKPIYHDGTEEGRKAALAGLVNNAKVSFSVVGENAANWDEIKHLAFRGRDDGKQRVELDASGAKVKGFPNAYPVQEVMRKLIHDGVYDSEDYMVYSSLAFAEDMTREERGERKLSETELKEDCDKYPDLAEEVELGLKAAGLTWESDVQEARGACFTALGKWKKTLEAELKQRNIEKPTGEAWHALVEQKPGLGSANVGKRVVSAWSGKWLDDVLDFPELYKAYPQLRSIQLAEDTGMELADASYADFARRHGAKEGKEDGQYPFGFINMNPKSSAWSNEQEAKGLLLHEVQHAIQGIEGFAKGGNPKTVREAVEKLLENDGFRIEWLERDLRWFAAINIARDYLNEAKRLRKYPNAWKYSGQRFRWSRISSSAEEIREAILRDIAERYEAFRRDDTAETLLLDMNDSLLPVVRFSSLESIEAGLEKLKMLKSRKQAFRGTSAKKGRKLADLQKRYDRMKRVLDKFKYEPFELYRRMAGEIESRNVELRRDWTAAERAARPFNETLEYPGEALVSYSMQRVTQRSLELLESRSEEEVAQQIMDDLRKACERLSLLMADDGTDVRRGNGLRVYAEMQALLSAVRQALPEKYLKQGNLEMLLRWASVYAKMATDGEVPARGLIKGDVFDSFVAVLEKQQKQGQLQGMSAEESREALMELAGEKLEVAFMKVARDCVRRIDQFLKDRALERIEWVYQHAYPTREEGRAWGRGKMDSENYRVVNAAWQLVQGSLNKRKEAEEEMRLVRRQMVKVREQMKGKEIEEGEGKRWLKKLNEQLAQLELAAMQAAAEQQAQLIKSISEELESLDTDAADFADKEAAANERMALQQTFGNWYYKDALEARRAARVFEDMVLRGKKQWEEKLKVEREEIAYWREQILSGFEVGREKATNRRMKQRNAVRTRLDKQLVGMGKGLMNFGHLMLALRPLLGRRFCDMKREQISQMHTNTMAFNTELKNWMFRTLRDITGLQTETEQELWLADQNQARDTGIVITERATVKAALTYAEAKRWLGMSVEEREKERARIIAEAAAAKSKPSNVPTEEMMEELGQLVSEYEKDNHGVDPQNKKFVVQAVEEWQTELHTTKDAILFGILTFEQPDYERLMEPNGITPEILDQMRRYVGPKMLRWGYAMREKLSEHGVNVARVFEEYTGIPFDSRENYFKGVFDQGALKEQTLEQAVAAASGASGTGSKYGSLIPRRYHMSKINWDTSAAGVFVTSMQQQNNYVQTSRMVRNWRALLTDKAFAARVEAEIGTAAKQQIIGWLELIEGAVVADVKMAELSNRMMRRLMGGYAKASLGGNIRTLIKQVSALLNGYAGGYVPDKWMLNNELCQEMTYRKIGFGEYMMALARVLSSMGSVSRGETKQQAFIYARKAVDGDGLLRVTYLAANQKLPGQADGWLGQKEVPKGVLAWLGQKANKVVEKAMDAIAVVDAEMCTASAMAIADVAYRQAVAADVQNVVPDDVKRAEALRLAGMALDVAGQPQLRTQKSYWAASGALGGMGDFLFMFRSDTLSKAGLWIAQATSGEGKSAVGGWLAFGIMNSLVLAMLEGLRGNLGDEDDEWYQYAAAFGMNVLTNDATALPVVGEMLAKVRAGIMGEPVFQNGLSDLVPFGEVFEYGKREVKNIRKGASWDRHWNATAGLLRALGSSCAVCQDSTIGPLANLSSLTMAAAVFANSTKFVQGLIKLGEEVTE